MDAIAITGFRLWDAPGSGPPSIHPVSSLWSESESHRVTLNRGDRDDLPQIAVSAMRPDVTSPPHPGLTLGALLEFAVPLSSAGPMNAREAAKTLFALSQSPGLPASLTVDGSVAGARRYEVPLTGDWVVTATAADLPVCVSGRGGLAVPELMAADMTVWGAPLRAQIAEAATRHAPR